MHYLDGEPMMVGDTVALGDDRMGRVVCSIDDGVFTDEHPESAWAYLGRGVMIDFPQWGLLHYQEPDADLQLVCRGPASAL